MKTIRFLLALCFACFAHSVLADEPAKPAAGLDATIEQGIKLLDDGKHQAFLEMFVPPEQYKAITANVAPEKFAKNFADGKAASLLAVLKDIKAKGTKPTLEEDGKKATFKISGDLAGGKGSIIFKLTGSNWYIQN